jgi:hypothetical protein
LCTGPRIEHPDDLARLVVDYRFPPPIPQDRNGDAADIIGISLCIDLPKELRVVDRIGIRSNDPAVGQHQWIDHGYADRVL